MRLGLRRFAGAANGDATTLDGLDSSYFATADHTHPPSGVTDHTLLSNIGTNTHAQIDTHMAATSGAHGISAFGATLVDDAAASNARTTLGLGTIATEPEASYALLAGRSGGQTLIGGTASGNSLTLQSSSHATKGKVIFGSAGTTVYDEVNNRIGIGIASPSRRLHLYDTVIGNVDALFQHNNGGTPIFFYMGVASASGSAFDAAGPVAYYGTGGGCPFVFAVDGVTRMKISTSGRISMGLSTTDAVALLELAGSATSRASLRMRSGTWPTTPGDGDFGNDGNAINIMVNGTNAVNTDGGIRIYMQSSTDDRPVGGLLWQYTTKTDATRATEGSLTAWYTTTERKAIRWGANSTVPLVGFYGVAPVAQPAAYTQTYSTATRTVNAYTTDDESAAYTGIDNAQAGTVYAQLTDVNALRTAYENLRASYDNLLQVVNSLIDDGQAVGLLQ